MSKHHKDTESSLPANCLLHLDHISYTCPDGYAVLKDIVLTLSAGERIGLVGDNGAGKTTLAHLIMGLRKADSGRVYLRGQPLVHKKDFRLLRREIGLLFQHADDQLFYPSVIEDVAFGPLNLGYSAAQAQEMAQATLRSLGIQNLHDRLIHTLSGGEKKLVSLACVLVMEPAALLLDEPTTGLDSTTRKQLIAVLHTLRPSCLIISHDWDFLAHTTDTVYALDKGRLSPAGSPHTHNHTHAHGNMPHTHEHLCQTPNTADTAPQHTSVKAHTKKTVQDKKE